MQIRDLLAKRLNVLGSAENIVVRTHQCGDCAMPVEPSGKHAILLAKGRGIDCLRTFRDDGLDHDPIDLPGKCFSLPGPDPAAVENEPPLRACLLYTSDAADE